MAGFTKEQEAFMEQVAWRIAEHLERRIADTRKADIDLHAASCSAAQKINALHARFCGVRAILVFLGLLIGAASGLVVLVMRLRETGMH